MKHIFRSWNEELKQFFYWEDGIYLRCGIDRDEFNLSLFNWQNAEMWTGKTDNYGRDIFENDSIEHIGCKGVADGISKIIWEDDYSCFYIENDELDIYCEFYSVDYNCTLIVNREETMELNTYNDIKKLLEKDPEFNRLEEEIEKLLSKASDEITKALFLKLDLDYRTKGKQYSFDEVMTMSKEIFMDFSKQIRDKEKI